MAEDYNLNSGELISEKKKQTILNTNFLNSKNNSNLKIIFIKK